MDIEDLEEDDDEYYDPNLYVPKTDWIPECEDEEIEGAYFKFQETLQEIHQALPYTKHFNLTKQQRSVLTELKERDDLVIFPTDKNLGPYIISREDYIKQCLNEHLLKGDYYLMLSDTDAEELLEKQRHSLDSLYYEHKDNLPSPHRQYFDRSIELLNSKKERIPQFYGI